MSVVDVKRDRVSPKSYKITSIGVDNNIYRKYFLIEGTILPRQGIKKVTSGFSLVRTKKFYLKIHYGWFSRSYTFWFESRSDINYIMKQLLRCVNYEND